MAFVEYSRASLPDRDYNINIPMYSKRLYFSKDILQKFPFRTWKFVTLHMDDTTSQIGIKEATDIDSLTSFDLYVMKSTDAFVSISEFMTEHSMAQDKNYIYDVAYDAPSEMYILTERV